MRRLYDHIDLRVRSLQEARAFYEAVLPALGFTRRMEVDGWLQFEAVGAGVDRRNFLASRRPVDTSRMSVELHFGHRVQPRSTV